MLIAHQGNCCSSIQEVVEGMRTLFRSRQHILAALEGANDGEGMSSTSLVSVGIGRRSPGADPFRPGFLNSLEVRSELIRLLGDLDARSRRLLVLWFVCGRPVAEVADDLGISRVHCYRLKNKALDAMLEASGEGDANKRAS
jgi:DNA-directed RNA polymerase specialized sigma24 family protein